MNILDILLATTLAKKGIKPAKIVPKGTAATTNDLPLSGNELGDIYLVLADGSLQMWTSEQATGTASDWTEMEIQADVTGLQERLKAGTAATAELHLGFYLDEDGDLCQTDEA